MEVVVSEVAAVVVAAEIAAKVVAEVVSHKIVRHNDITNQQSSDWLWSFHVTRGKPCRNRSILENIAPLNLTVFLAHILVHRSRGPIPSNTP